jgi:hypothetical protein
MSLNLSYDNSQPVNYTGRSRNEVSL